MRLPRSLGARLFALSLLATALALAIAGMAVDRVLERFVTATWDDRLADKLAALSGAVRRDGTLDTDRARRFDSRAGVTLWRIDAPSGSLTGGGRAGTQTGAELGAIRLLPIRPHRSRDADRPRPPAPPLRPFEARLTDGEPVHGRADLVATDRGPALVAVAIPRTIIDRPLREAFAPLLLSLAAVGTVLVAAAAAQTRWGLRPVRRLQAEVAAMRAGVRERVGEDGPTELRPLAAELNALLADNAAALTAARASSANLAHALKTPVATLALDVAAEPARAAQVARIDATIRHHLARARAEAIDRRASTPLAPAVSALLTAVRRLYRERALKIVEAIEPGIAVAVDARDLDELVGNLLDNAARHARTAISINAARLDPRRLALIVADDGPGIPAAARDTVTRPGARLDEAGDGHGFGLAIAADLARLYGGCLTLDDAPGGGLAATLTLPAARG